MKDTWEWILAIGMVGLALFAISQGRGQNQDNNAPYWLTLMKR